MESIVPMCAELQFEASRLYEFAVSSQRQAWVAVARVDELAERTTKKFFAFVDGAEEECFVVRFEGRFYAYVNRCCHVPLTLDWVENRFFSVDGRYLQCATHGALYLPDSGECVAGPPCGKYLRKLDVMVTDDTVFVAVDQHPERQQNC